VNGEHVAELLSELLRACRRGDEQAMGRLVDRFSRSAHALAAAIVNDDHLAEDAVQNSFLAALTRLDQLRDTKAFPGWFRQIVRTEAHRILRHRREPTTGPMKEMNADGPTPGEDAQASELRSIVREAVRKLPPPRCQPTELFYFEEHSCAEIAQLLHVPTGTVKRRLHDARRQLRSMLLGYVSDEIPPEKPEAPPEWPLPL
jgi:RNA polymerase sigma-70 factor (ECF subfamily)